jgi:hypothetical protein
MFPTYSDQFGFDIPESLRKLVDGAIQGAYELGFIQGFIAGIVALLVLNFIFGRKG